MAKENRHSERNYLEIDLKQIQQNARHIKEFVKNVKLMSVIKGDAYGLGIKPAAQVIEEYSDGFAVSTPQEALALRDSGIEIPILILGYVADEYIPQMIEHNITLTGLSLEYIKHLNAIVPNHTPLEIHIKIDTGLARLGLYHSDFDIEKYIEDIKAILVLEHIKVTGIYSHFAAADSTDEADVKYTEKQYAIFKAILDRADELGLELGVKHICSSNAIFDHQDKYLDMIRIGKYFFGYGQEKDKEALNVKTPFNLYARIIRIVDLPKGQSVGYGRTFETEKETKLATVTFGFADGFRRNMSGKIQVIVNGQKADVVGRIAADYMHIDITGIEDVKVGDYVLLMGRDGDETLYPSEMGQIIEGSTPELNTQLHSRVPRVYLNHPVQ